jgi:hypothetical protein
MKEAFKNTMRFFAVSAASSGVAAGIVGSMSKEKGYGPTSYHYCSAGIIPMWDKQKPENSGNAFGAGAGYFYPSFSGGVQGKSFTEEQHTSVGFRK